MLTTLLRNISLSMSHSLSRSVCLQGIRYKSLTSNVNDKVTEQAKNAAKKKKPSFQSMWKTNVVRDDTVNSLYDYPPECCPRCDSDRFDLLYYRPSNKCRSYQRTWWECVPCVIPKVICCSANALPPEYEKRNSPRLSPCLLGKGNQRKCSPRKDTACPRIAIPFCRSGRDPPFCDIVRRKSDCEKIKCPFPSYSECDRELPACIPQRPPECRCNRPESVCIALRYKTRSMKDCLKFCPCSKCPYVKDN